MRKETLKELEPFESPVYNAPRRRKETYDVVSNEFVKKLKKDNPQIKGIHIRDIRKLVKEFHENKLVDYLVNNREPIHLPHMIGAMVVAVYGKTNTVDKALSMKIGKKVHYRSSHSNGYGAAIYYTTSHMYTRNVVSRHIWWFYPSTNAKKKLADKMLDGESWRTFMYMRNKKHIRGTLRKEYTPSSFSHYKKKDFENYNELDITIED